MKWVTVKQSSLLKGGVNNGKMMGLFADRRFKREILLVNTMVSIKLNWKMRANLVINWDILMQSEVWIGNLL